MRFGQYFAAKQRDRRHLLALALVFVLISACNGSPGSTTTNNPGASETEPTATAQQSEQVAASDLQSTHANSDLDSAGDESESQSANAAATDWKSWPVLPTVSDEMRSVYQRGLEAGNDPHAFSILGDCLSLPEEFLGVYENDRAAVEDLPEHLQETVRNFSGSFDRYSPAVKIGTTTGALLWGEWNDNEENLCTPNETPLDCELRVHRPSIVFIHIGTHWETRNYQYLTVIVETILKHGAVPVVVTKADNRELDERVNEDYAALAVEFDLPLWNFWATVRDLPDNGLAPDSPWELSEEASEIHRLSGLEALDAVWRGVQ